MTADIAFVAMMALWACAELALVVWMRATAADDSHRDRGTLRLVLLAIAAALGGGACLSYAGIGAWPAAWIPVLRWIGAAAIALGLAIRWIAIRTLRHYFTITVAIRADHRLVDWGLYRYVRHPSYSGAILGLFGLGLGSGGWLPGLVLTVPIVFAVVRRIQAEETALAEGLGVEYAAWRARTPSLVPRLFAQMPQNATGNDDRHN